jgi:hypothetical protein
VDWDTGTVEAETTSFSPYAALAVPAAPAAPSYSTTVVASSGSGTDSQTVTLAASIVGAVVGVSAIAGITVWRMRAQAHGNKSKATGALEKTPPSGSAPPGPSKPDTKSGLSDHSQEQYSPEPGPDLPASTRDVILLQPPPKRARNPARKEAAEEEGQRPDWVSADLGVTYPPGDKEAVESEGYDEPVVAERRRKESKEHRSPRQDHTRPRSGKEERNGAAAHPRPGPTAATLKDAPDAPGNDEEGWPREIAKKYMDRCSTHRFSAYQLGAWGLK